MTKPFPATVCQQSRQWVISGPLAGEFLIHEVCSGARHSWRPCLRCSASTRYAGEEAKKRECRKVWVFHLDFLLSTDTCFAVKSTVTTGSLKKSVPLRKNNCRHRCFEQGSFGSLERIGSPETRFSEAAAGGIFRCPWT